MQNQFEGMQSGNTSGEQWSGDGEDDLGNVLGSSETPADNLDQNNNEGQSADDSRDPSLDSAVNDIDQAMAAAMSEAQESNIEVESTDDSAAGESEVVI